MTIKNVRKQLLQWISNWWNIMYRRRWLVNPPMSQNYNFTREWKTDDVVRIWRYVVNSPAVRLLELNISISIVIKQYLWYLIMLWGPRRGEGRGRGLSGRGGHDGGGLRGLHRQVQLGGAQHALLTRGFLGWIDT